MSEEIIEILGSEAGPTSIILAGVHGDEKCGVTAINNVLSGLKIDKGRLLVGIGNPRAIEKGLRFTEANLNRMFVENDKLSPFDKKSYEYKRANYLKTYLDKADVLLDIHATTIPNSKPFLICEKSAIDVIKYLPVELVVVGFDEIEPGGTDYYMNKKGKVGICLESGFVDEPESIILAEKSIFAFLKAVGHIDLDITPQYKTMIHMYELYLTNTSSFNLIKPFENFEVIEENQVIGVDGNDQIKAKKESVILFAHNCNKIGSEAFLLGDKKLSPA